MQLFDMRTIINRFILPQNCILCGDACGQQPICTGCTADLPFHRTPCCPMCALPTPQAEVCGSCLQHPPHFDATVAAMTYDFPADALLRALKYQGRLEIGELLAIALAQRLTGHAKPDLVIPMPLHPSRLQERGFNQAAEIGRRVARLSDIPFEAGIALRVRATQPQAGLALKKRRKNLRGAFASAQTLSGKKIAVVDDVMTTGTSLDELAKTLKAAGATQVECWIVARTLKT